MHNAGAGTWQQPPSFLGTLGNQHPPVCFLSCPPGGQVSHGYGRSLITGRGGGLQRQKGG